MCNSYDFSVFGNVEIINADLSAMSKEQLELLYQQARYCQAMTDSDIDTLREMIPERRIIKRTEQCTVTNRSTGGQLNRKRK